MAPKHFLLMPWTFHESTYSAYLKKKKVNNCKICLQDLSMYVSEIVLALDIFFWPTFLNGGWQKNKQTHISFEAYSGSL